MPIALEPFEQLEVPVQPLLYRSCSSSLRYLASQRFTRFHFTWQDVETHATLQHWKDLEESTSL